MRSIVLATAVFSTMTGQVFAAERAVKTAYLACRLEPDFERAEGLRRSGDVEAIKLYISGAMLAGSCVWLPIGTVVFDEGAGSVAGNTKVRPKGSINSYYTVVG